MVAMSTNTAWRRVYTAWHRFWGAGNISPERRARSLAQRQQRQQRLARRPVTARQIFNAIFVQGPLIVLGLTIICGFVAGDSGVYTFFAGLSFCALPVLMIGIFGPLLLAFLFAPSPPQRVYVLCGRCHQPAPCGCVR